MHGRAKFKCWSHKIEVPIFGVKRTHIAHISTIYAGVHGVTSVGDSNCCFLFPKCAKIHTYEQLQFSTFSRWLTRGPLAVTAEERKWGLGG